VLTLALGGGLAYALTKEDRGRITSDEIIARGKKSNERFRSGKSEESNHLSAVAQYAD
jgi:hypothetical protein